MARPRNHLKWGWAALFFAIVGGIALESLHAFKAETFLGVDQETTRLMWRLAHAHGALLGVVNILYALTCHHQSLEFAQDKTVSTALIMATILLPGGFLLGGIMPMDGDPGIGIILIPLGGVALLFAVFRILLQVR